MDEVDQVDLMFLKFNDVMENTFLVKLSRNYNEIDHHKEYDIRRTNLQRNVSHLRELLKGIDLNTHENSYEIIASLIILCKELSIKSEYNPKKAPEYIRLLHSDFEMKYGVTLDNLLITGEKFDSQLIFDNCMEKIHQKLIPSAFKKYPSLIDVYYLIINDLKTYNVTVSPLKTLPVALILIDDFVDNNKIKGLKSCLTILQYTQEDNSFINGNYHEVIYKSLWKAVKDEKFEAMRLGFECFHEYLKVLPKELKKQKMNDILYKSLNELQIDNVYRKKEYFIFIQPFISIDTLKRQKLFESIIIDNLDQCTMESYRELLFKDVIQCFQIWIKHCWSAWYFPTSCKLLAALIKILFVLKNEETDFLKTVEEVIITLIDISESKHQKEILLQLQGASDYNNEIFSERINKIRSKYNVLRECDVTFELGKYQDVTELD